MQLSHSHVCCAQRPLKWLHDEPAQYHPVNRLSGTRCFHCRKFSPTLSASPQATFAFSFQRSKATARPTSHQCVIKRCVSIGRVTSSLSHRVSHSPGFPDSLLLWPARSFHHTNPGPPPANGKYIKARKTKPCLHLSSDLSTKTVLLLCYIPKGTRPLWILGFPR
jgi:hypothetical protein